MLLNETVTLQLTGNSPTGLAVTLTPSYALKNASVDDYVHETFAVNPATTAASVSMGKITTGKHLWVQTDGAVTLLVTQTNGQNSVLVNGAFMLDGDFTAVAVTNAGSVAVNATFLITGNRAANTGSAGIY